MIPGLLAPVEEVVILLSSCYIYGHGQKLLMLSVSILVVDFGFGLLDRDSNIDILGRATAQQRVG